jgi:NTP pyrophosphatase (non-canonical NTP hydrolase)
MKISEFQNLMRDLYIHQDSKRGLKSTFIWLVEEIGELASLLKDDNLDKQKISEELADIIAWTSSLANLLNIDLETALVEKYPNKCKKCNSFPCRCMELKKR